MSRQDNLAFLEGGLEVAVQRAEEFLRERKIGFNTQLRPQDVKLSCASSPSGKALQLFSLSGIKCLGKCIVVSFLLTLNHNRVDPAVGVFVGLSREIGQLLSFIPLLQDGDVRANGNRHETFHNSL